MDAQVQNFCLLILEDPVIGERISLDPRYVVGVVENTRSLSDPGSSVAREYNLSLSPLSLTINCFYPPHPVDGKDGLVTYSISFTTKKAMREAHDSILEAQLKLQAPA